MLLFVHCHCHQLQLACVQAANGTAGIEHVFLTLTILWKYFYYSHKPALSLKEVQKVLDFPDLKIVKTSDKHWLAHARCVRAVKATCSVLWTIFIANHTNQRLWELKKLFARNQQLQLYTYLLDYVFIPVAKLIRALQTENLDLSMISSLLDATLHSIDDEVLSSSN